ncbi:MAG: Asp-tRNA(Asn)/Glu-tRNA(Gln) amidotransferase subunit GatC [Spirochaetales bacterium]|nr:Asp-tRNA(Asn)/Glu-tRNA(Gln) amidotransferase subunit GatC [Spirochaetales bacterium]
MDIHELRITAELAMLDLDEREMKVFEAEVSKTLEYFAQMNAVDVDGLEPTTHVLMEENRAREDRTRDENLSDRLLEEAPERQGRHIVIPNVL